MHFPAFLVTALIAPARFASEQINDDSGCYVSARPASHFDVAAENFLALLIPHPFLRQHSIK
jgi:hypothetical protein